MLCEINRFAVSSRNSSVRGKRLEGFDSTTPAALGLAKWSRNVLPGLMRDPRAGALGWWGGVSNSTPASANQLLLKQITHPLRMKCHTLLSKSWLSVQRVAVDLLLLTCKKKNMNKWDEREGRCYKCQKKVEKEHERMNNVCEWIIFA